MYSISEDTCYEKNKGEYVGEGLLRSGVCVCGGRLQCENRGLKEGGGPGMAMCPAGSGGSRDVSEAGALSVKQRADRHEVAGVPEW